MFSSLRHGRLWPVFVTLFRLFDFFASKYVRIYGFILFFSVFCIVINIWLISIWFSLRSTNIVHTERFICPSWSGRLGNIMFQYASLYGIAVRNGMTLVVRDDAELYDVFDYLYANKIKNDSFCDEAEYMEESEPCLYDEDAANIDSSQNIFHDSLLQSWRYFSDVEDDIRKQFRFRENIEILCQEIVNDAVMNWTFGKSHDMVNDLQIVGIHIRRGDYVSKKNIKYGYQTATPEYMNKSMNYFREKFQNVLFLAYTNPTSDDLLWRQNNVIGSDVIHMRMFTAEVDMCSLTKCNHSIITVGSFGWWAAWLVNGLTIYYKDIARNGSEYRGDFSENMTDFFYPGWIGF